MDFGLHDSLSAFFAICCLTGFLLSLVTTFAGSLGHGFHHLHLHVPKSLHGLHGGRAGKMLPAGQSEGMPMVNFSSLTAFAMWLGGIGWILHGFLHLPLLLVLTLALAGGLLGGAVVHLFIQKVLLKGQHVLRPEDFHLPGTLGQVRVAIPAGGTGEVVFKQNGARRVVWAVSSNGSPIAKDTEVLIERAEAGLVYVAPAHDLAPGGQVAAAPPPRERDREFS